MNAQITWDFNVKTILWVEKLELDQSNVSDTINHTTLLKDIEQTTLPTGLKKWIKDYLRGGHSSILLRILSSTSTSRNFSNHQKIALPTMRGCFLLSPTEHLLPVKEWIYFNIAYTYPQLRNTTQFKQILLGCFCRTYHRSHLIRAVSPPKNIKRTSYHII